MIFSTFWLAVLLTFAPEKKPLLKESVNPTSTQGMPNLRKYDLTQPLMTSGEYSSKRKWDEPWRWVINGSEPWSTGDNESFRLMVPVHRSCSLVATALARMVYDSCGESDYRSVFTGFLHGCVYSGPINSLAGKCARDTAEDAAKIGAMGIIRLKSQDHPLVKDMSVCVLNNGSIMQFGINGTETNLSLIGIGQNSSYTGMAEFAKKLIEYGQNPNCSLIAKMDKVFKEALLLIRKPECNQNEYDQLQSAESIDIFDTESFTSLCDYLIPPDQNNDFNDVDICLFYSIMLCAFCCCMSRIIGSNGRQDRLRVALGFY